MNRLIMCFSVMAVLGPSTAFAEGQDLDISIIQPSFSTMSIPGIQQIKRKLKGLVITNMEISDMGFNHFGYATL